jgi:hypothetical protein
MIEKSQIIELAEDLDAMYRGQISENEIRHKYRKHQNDEIAEIMANLEHYLSDSDIREKDPGYRKMQETEMRKLIQALRTGNLRGAVGISFLRESETYN